MSSYHHSHFKMDTAKEMIDAFTVSTGVTCGFYSLEGEMLHMAGCPQECCMICKELSKASGVSLCCEGLHVKAIQRAEQFGGRYIYVCPAGMMFTASPIIYEGSIAGALIAGPVLSMEVNEFLENDARASHITDCTALDHIRELLSVVPFVEPKRMNGISMQIFANAVFISDESRELFLAQNKNVQQNSIGEYIHQIKNDQEYQQYPIETERELIKAISCGDRTEAARLLNEILGYIFFSNGGNQSAVRTRVFELLVVLSRAAISGGANAKSILHITEQYMKALRRLNGLDEFTQYLAEILNHFTSLVFDVAEYKHRNAIYSAVDYMRQNYARNITLNEVADYVGYSHSYFSNIFKKEMECSFRTYLNRIRIDKSKFLLLSGKMSVPEICEMTGFTDQSTFGKAFKQETGVTPGRYRKINRRIDIDKEHGIL